ncbi:urease accessory protein UreD [Nocardia sp. 348MFTsu5.1]|uniref:urease accessory protein UreD n=1 Tax=Nocardia sp. 348MFTsu5.1 TaxID=1172185 RepID=UPI0003709DE0|nr:urease accessory protein UreD [Nocardia sp. 348MFTsu5.1]
MHTEVHLEAVKGRSPRIRATGGMAARQTGIDVLHLISTAATPLGGDTVDIHVDVGCGSTLTVFSVAATVALPSRGEPRSQLNWHITVADGAHLVIDPLPTIVAAHAVHHSNTTVSVAGSGTVRICERVQIGRFGEDEGAWSGRLNADIDGIAAVRHQVRLGKQTHDRLGAHAVLISEFCYPDDRDDLVHPTAAAARLRPAAGGSLTTVLADTMPHAERVAGELRFAGELTGG